MRRLKIKRIVLGIGLMAILLLIILPMGQAFAQEGYKLLAPLPGLDRVLPEQNILGKYLRAIFELAIGLAVVATVLRIIMGGFKYMSTDAFQGKQEGKDMAWNAVKALVLVLAAWLILNEINPKLLEFDLSISPVEVKAPAGGAVVGGAPWVNLTQAQIDESNATREALKKEGVDTYRSPCTTEGVSTNCVNLNGLSEAIKNSAINLKKACRDCNITITAGTEGGHSINSLHNTGNAVDLRNDSNLTSFIVKNAVDYAEFTDYGKRYELNLGGQTVYFLDEGTHWHVSTSEDHD